ncbi:MAG: iron-containing alcohol dehydrogenase, partial [Thermodesulfobacteriota bacterium]|nr:iron-containing alcohol dehydrogenase [Thermodesulfobacteriota bacterium]
MNRTFSFTGAKKIVFGNGTFEQLAEHIRDLGGKTPLIVLDRNLSLAGLREKVSGYFEKIGMGAIIFDRVEGEPPLELADEGAVAAANG